MCAVARALSDGLARATPSLTLCSDAEFVLTGGFHIRPTATNVRIEYEGG